MNAPPDFMTILMRHKFDFFPMLNINTMCKLLLISAKRFFFIFNHIYKHTLMWTVFDNFRKQIYLDIFEFLNILTFISVDLL